MNITAHLCTIYAILAMMAGTMFFDRIDPTHLPSKQITLVKKDMLQDLIEVFENRFFLDDKIETLRKDVFADVMNEVKTMSLFRKRTEQSKKPENEWIDDTEDEMVEDRLFASRSDSTSDHIKSNNYEDERIREEKMKMNSERNFAFDSKKSGEWITSSMKSNLKEQKELFSLTEQNVHSKRQHNADHRNLEQLFPDCNETLFHFEIELHPFQTEASWDLVDTATNTTIVEKKYANNTDMQQKNETMCLKDGSYKVTLYDSDEDSVVCIPFSLIREDPCYRIFVDHQMVAEGIAFGSQKSHTFDSSALCLIGSSFLLESNLDFNDPNIKMQLQDDISGQVFNLSTTPIQNDNFTYFYFACVSSPGFYSFSIEAIEQGSTVCDEFDGCYRISINEKTILEKNDIFEKSIHKIRTSESGDGVEFICNGTIFRLDVLLDWDRQQTSWELRDVKEGTIVDNASYEETGQRQLVHKEICVEPGPYVFTLYDSGGGGIDCGLNSCYNISIDNNMVIQGSTFREQISHRFDSSPSSLCLIHSTFLLELRLDQNHSNFNSYVHNEVTGDTFNLIETPIRNDNYTNSFYACLLPGIYAMDRLHLDNFPVSGCGSSDCFQVSINNGIIANGNDFLSLVQFRFSLSINFIAGQRYCHRSPFLSFLDIVEKFPWNKQSSRIMNDIRSLSSHETLSNIQTPQYKAACWKLYDDNTMNASIEDEFTLERYALGVFLSSTNQDAEMMLSGDSCDLDGITCDDMGHIVEINWREYALIVLMICILLLSAYMMVKLDCIRHSQYFSNQYDSLMYCTLFLIVSTGSREISGIIPSEISFLRFLGKWIE